MLGVPLKPQGFKYIRSYQALISSELFRRLDHTADRTLWFGSGFLIAFSQGYMLGDSVHGWV